MSPALEALAWSLLHSLWQGLVLAGILAAVTPALRRYRAEAAYAAACAALLVLALLPAATWLMLVGALAQEAPPGRQGLVREGLGLLPVLLASWLAGVALLAVRLLGGLWQLERTVHMASSSGRLQTIADRLRLEAGVARATRVLESARVSVPMVVGWLRPVIIIPTAALSGLPTSALEAVLLHELVHVRRLDWLVNLIQSCVEVLLFHNPFAWWISAQVRIEREHCCDDVVVALRGDASGYARALVALESIRPRPSTLAPTSNGGNLMKRIIRLLRPSRQSTVPTPLWLAPALLLTIAVTLGAMTALAQTAHEVAEDGWLPPSVTAWSEHFEAAGNTHGVDPKLLAVMALVESRGNPDAVSPGGAVGLMQVMPATAARIAQARGVPFPDALADPATNIDFAAWYMARQLDAFADQEGRPDTVELALYAYNAGPRRVRSWLDGEATLTTENIHYKQLVSALWREIDDPESLAYRTWQQERP